MKDLRRRGPAGLNTLDVGTAIARLTAGEITSEALVADCLKRIAARDADLCAWAFIDPELALIQARQCDGEAPRGPLHGVPVGIKDILDTKDMPTEYGSAIHRGHRPVSDTSCVTALRNAGAVILGKTATTEFASPVPIGFVIRTILVAVLVYRQAAQQRRLQTTWCPSRSERRPVAL